METRNNFGYPEIPSETVTVEFPRDLKLAEIANALRKLGLALVRKEGRIVAVEVSKL